MTTKFSQGAATQTLPPVCHPPIPLPTGWLPPLYPPMYGFLAWELDLWDDSIAYYKSPAKFRWAGVPVGWIAERTTIKYYFKITIGPPLANQPLKITSHFEVIWAADWNVELFGPAYIPGQTWESGQITFKADWRPAILWQTFATWKY